MGRMGIFFRKIYMIKSLYILIISASALVFYHEYLQYHFYSFYWPSLKNVGPAENNVRLLFVADPQLIGLRDEDKTRGPITRWDADTYLSRTYSYAYSSVKPDAVIFLGDLLDEGSQASESEYQSYVHRFNSIFNSTGTAKHIYLAGDNDIGGEGIDAIEAWKIAKFERYFNKEAGMDTVKFIDFFRVSFQRSYNVESLLTPVVKHMRAQSTGDIRILLNHFRILDRLYQQYKEVLEHLAPSVIFSAHSHESHVIKCDDCRTRQSINDWKQELKNWEINSFPLHSDKKDNYQEINIPTCSYRMGARRMGYGAAVISKDGLLQYSVLWMPSRYSQLYAYIRILSVVLILLIIRFIIPPCYLYRRQIFCGAR